MKQKLWILLALVCLIALLLPVTVSAEVQDGFSADGNNYYRDGQMVTDEIIEYGGELYAFDGSGWKFNGQEFWMNDSWYRAKEDGTLYVNEWYAYEDGEKVAYYGEDGKALQDFQYIDGVWYYLRNDGYVTRNQPVWSEDYQAWYWMSQDGTSHTKLPTQQWYQDSEGDWYYFSKDGSVSYDFVKIGNKWYFLTERCRLACDDVVWSDMDQKFYALSADGESYQELPNVAGWHQAFGAWYYAQQDGEYVYYVSDEVVEYKNNRYYLQDNGQMLVNDAVEYYDYEAENWFWACADADGILSDSGWYERDGKWHYILDGQRLFYGVYEIGGKLYMFDYGYLMDKADEYYWDGNFYRVRDDSGELLRNEWYFREICYPTEKGWMYYGNDGVSLENTITLIGNKLYGFNSDGIMLENDIMETEDGVCMFDKDGVGKWLTDEWYQHPETGEWFYIRSGHRVFDIVDINGKTYGFPDGYMVEGDYCYSSYNGTYGEYLFDNDGVMVTKTGWIYQNGWYYVNADKTLQTGWLQSGGKWYLMDPMMVTDTLYYEPDEKVTYAIDSDGVATALKKNGLETLTSWYGWITVYIQDGKVLTNTWKQVDGYWYYFGEDGVAYSSDVYMIGNASYLFNYYGQMMTGGWVTMYGDWYYADPANDSALATGMKTIGGSKYIFSQYGYMYSGVSVAFDGTTYLLGGNGRVLTALKSGWNQYNGNWYFVNEYGDLAVDTVVNDNGKYYLFDEMGRMCSGCVYMNDQGKYVVNADGVIQTGWQEINGKWIYWYDEDGLYMASGWCDIDGKQYIFDDDCFLRIGTFFRYGWVYTTDSDGAVIKETRAEDGWTYSDGYWYYLEDGDYTGWLGDYYIADSTMVFNTVIEDNGKHYFIQANGLLLKNGWGACRGSYMYGETDWVLAKADGSLYCSEWVQKDGAWYYFYGHYMVADCAEYIDGTYHEFDEGGKWLGEDSASILPTGRADGWQKVSGNWYYFKNGAAVTGEIYWNGNRYLLDYRTGIMVTNGIGFCNGVNRYYNADGVAVEYVGWKQINGNWYLFKPDHTLYFGLAKDSVGMCYVERDYTKNSTVSRLVKNEYYMIGGELYYFDASGYTQGAISTNGWYQAGSDWYYFENGSLIGFGYRVINGTGYYFYDGLMETDEVLYFNNGYRYVDKTGKVVTQQGWYQTEDGDWVYAQQGGELYGYGIYTIGGKEYTFCDGILISE